MSIFFLIFFSVYGGANFYIFYRSLQAIELAPMYLKITFGVFFWLSATSYVLIKALVPSDFFLYDLMSWVGSLWYPALMYSILLVLLIDILRAINHFLPFFPAFVTTNIPAAKLTAFGIIVLSVTIFNIYGYLNAKNIKVKEMTIELPKGEGTRDTLRVLFVSDTHFSPMQDTSTVNKIIAINNKLKPDLILMGGDVVDDKSKVLRRLKIDKALLNLKAPLGVITCNGNHEHIVGMRDAVNFMEESGITVLIDSTMVVDNSVIILGREDRAVASFSGGKRKSIPEILQGVERNLPVILLDHQPHQLHEASDNNIELQLSGHTHEGQMFPINFIVQKIYEKSWGYYTKGKTQYYITSGAGTWGPPVRTFSDSEVILMTIVFKD